MSKEPNLATLPILFGIILTIIAPSVGVWTINSAYGKVSNNVKNVNFEIFECTVQGNSTHEISGPCPEVGGESPAVNVDKSPETKSPETKSPETKSPETKSPETKRKETKSTETKSPETKSPETKSPETKSPETKMPETKSPETKSPETKSPETKSPETKADTSANNKLAKPKIMEDNSNKYDFNEIHLSSPEMEVHKYQETEVLVPTLPGPS